MNKIIDYDNFFLPVNDLEKGIDFYQNVLGLEIKFDFSDKGMTAFKVGESEPAIILSNMQYARPAIWFTVENVRNVYNNFQKKGVVFLSEPFEIMTGWAVEFNDPFGNKLGLTDYSREGK